MLSHPRQWRMVSPTHGIFFSEGLMASGSRYSGHQQGCFKSKSLGPTVCGSNKKRPWHCSGHIWIFSNAYETLKWGDPECQMMNIYIYHPSSEVKSPNVNILLTKSCCMRHLRSEETTSRIGPFWSQHTAETQVNLFCVCSLQAGNQTSVHVLSWSHMGIRLWKHPHQK